VRISGREGAIVAPAMTVKVLTPSKVALMLSESE